MKRKKKISVAHTCLTFESLLHALPELGISNNFHTQLYLIASPALLDWRFRVVMTWSLRLL